MRILWSVVYEDFEQGNSKTGPGEKFSMAMRFFTALNYIRIFRDAKALQLVSTKFAGLRIDRRFIWGKL